MKVHSLLFRKKILFHKTGGNTLLISIVIPCYRSEKTIGKVIEEIKGVFAAQSEYDYEIILVNDCSPDNTLDEIRKICQNDKKITGVNLSRNYGQASAKLASLEYINGDIAVFMDDDGQHPASGILTLVKKIQEGYDVVYAHFKQKQHSLFKRATSSLQRKLAIWAGNSPKGIYGSSFLAYSRFIVDSLKNYKSPFVSIGGYLSRITTKFANVEMKHRDRIEGTSGYNFKKLLNLWLNTITNFSIVPIRLASFIGFISAAIGLIFGTATVIRKFIHPEIAAGYTSTISVLFFIGGVIMLILGLLGEYIGRIYMSISDSPQYTIREVINNTTNNEENI